ncbi:hypothetical protein GXW82_02565 [Streptacidiphilus sp. 4-A2]|nr:hypothetical protein [Streptacidiphilus sp. 4-A2]
MLEVEFTGPTVASRATHLWTPDGAAAEAVERRLDVDDHHRIVLVAADTGPGLHGVRLGVLIRYA